MHKVVQKTCLENLTLSKYNDTFCNLHNNTRLVGWTESIEIQGNREWKDFQTYIRLRNEITAVENKVFSAPPFQGRTYYNIITESNDTLHAMKSNYYMSDNWTHFKYYIQGRRISDARDQVCRALVESNDKKNNYTSHEKRMLREKKDDSIRKQQATKQTTLEQPSIQSTLCADCE